MKLTELLEKQKIIVQLVWDENKLEFFSEVIEKDDESIYITPCMNEGRELEINVTHDKAVICNIFTDDSANQQRISWRNVELLTAERSGRMLYRIKTHIYNNISNIEDRRGAERTVVSVDGEILDGRDNVRIIVHDISDSGISIYVPKSFIPKSQQLKITFSDKVDDEAYDIEAVFSIARTEYMSDCALIGCRLIGEGNIKYRTYNHMKKIYQKHENKSGATLIISRAS